MLSKDEIRKKAEHLLGNVWSAARAGDGRMGNTAEAALASLVLDQIDARDQALKSVLCLLVEGPEAAPDTWHKAAVNECRKALGLRGADYGCAACGATWFGSKLDHECPKAGIAK